MNISCEIILDLIPLVVDDVASVESKDIVLEHIRECTSCKQIYDNMLQEKQGLDTNQIMKKDTLILKLQKRIFIKEIVVLMVGMIPALCLLEAGMLMFYNIILMPFIGCLSYFNLRRKWYYTPIGIFLICFLYEVCILLFHPSAFTSRLAYSIVFMFLSMLGVLLGFLLQYAFGKEKTS